MQPYCFKNRLLYNVMIKHTGFFILVFLFSLTAFSQKYDSWKLYHNRKEIAAFNLKKETNDERKVLLLYRSLDEPGFLIFEYEPASAQKDWIRTITFTDSADKELKKYENANFLRIHNNEALRIIQSGGGQGIKVYSMAIPKDPELAATIRVRRILLCTLYTR